VWVITLEELTEPVECRLHRVGLAERGLEEHLWKSREGRMRN
jgi:hypothetical protein